MNHSPQQLLFRFWVDCTLPTRIRRADSLWNQEGEQYADRIAGPRNEMLELLLLGLEHKADQQKSSL